MNARINDQILIINCVIMINELNHQQNDQNSIHTQIRNEFRILIEYDLIIE